jgi:hypothetical protein
MACGSVGAFFSDGALNFAHNLLSLRDEAEAILIHGEDKISQRWTWTVRSSRRSPSCWRQAP